MSFKAKVMSAEVLARLLKKYEGNDNAASAIVADMIAGGYAPNETQLAEAGENQEGFRKLSIMLQARKRELIATAIERQCGPKPESEAEMKQWERKVAIVEEKARHYYNTTALYNPKGFPESSGGGRTQGKSFAEIIGEETPDFLS